MSVFSLFPFLETDFLSIGVGSESESSSSDDSDDDDDYGEYDNDDDEDNNSKIKPTDEEHCNKIIDLLRGMHSHSLSISLIIHKKHTYTEHWPSRSPFDVLYYLSYWSH